MKGHFFSKTACTNCFKSINPWKEEYLSKGSEDVLASTILSLTPVQVKLISERDVNRGEVVSNLIESLKAQKTANKLFYQSFSAKKPALATTPSGLPVSSLSCTQHFTRPPIAKAGIGFLPTNSFLAESPKVYASESIIIQSANRSNTFVAGTPFATASTDTAKNRYITPAAPPSVQKLSFQSFGSDEPVRIVANTRDDITSSAHSTECSSSSNQISSEGIADSKYPSESSSFSGQLFVLSFSTVIALLLAHFDHTSIADTLPGNDTPEVS